MHRLLFNSILKAVSIKVKRILESLDPSTLNQLSEFFEGTVVCSFHIVREAAGR